MESFPIQTKHSTHTTHGYKHENHLDNTNKVRQDDVNYGISKLKKYIIFMSLGEKQCVNYDVYHILLTPY